MEKNPRIIRLTPDHVYLPFDCGDSNLNDFLVSHAKAYQEKLLAITYLIESAGNTVLYFTLSRHSRTPIVSEERLKVYSPTQNIARTILP